MARTSGSCHQLFLTVDRERARTGGHPVLIPEKCFDLVPIQHVAQRIVVPVAYGSNDKVVRRSSVLRIEVEVHDSGGPTVIVFADADVQKYRRFVSVVKPCPCDLLLIVTYQARRRGESKRLTRHHQNGLALLGDKAGRVVVACLVG